MRLTMNTRQRPILFLLCMLLSLSASHFEADATLTETQVTYTVEATLDSLDRLINQRYIYTRQKEKQIQEIKLRLRNKLSPEERFRTLGYLVDAYRAFSIDSQAVYVKRQIELSDKLNNSDLQIQAQLNLVECFYNSGMYKEANELLEKMERKKLPHYIRPYYYHLKRTLYGLLADYSLQPDIRDSYTMQLNLYRDSILQVNSPSSFTYCVVKSD